MKILLTDRQYYWYGDIAEVRFINSVQANKSVSFSVIDTNPEYSWIGTTDQFGVLDTSFSVDKNIFSKTGIYQLKATCEGAETRIKFAVDYRGYIIGTVLSFLMKAFTQVGVHNELAVLEYGYNTANFGFKNWDWQSTRTQFFRDNEPLQLYKDLYPDYNGRVYFNTGVEGSDIFANYDFKYFTDSDFGAGLHFALNRLNISQPVTSYTFDDCPREYDAILVAGAYSFLLERAIKDSSFWQNAYVIKDNSVLSNFSNLLAGAKAEFEGMLKAKTRKSLKPLGISGFKLAMPFTIDQDNWRQYTIGALTLESR
jgi:hypothetical protein